MLYIFRKYNSNIKLTITDNSKGERVVVTILINGSSNHLSNHYPVLTLYTMFLYMNVLKLILQPVLFLTIVI